MLCHDTQVNIFMLSIFLQTFSHPSCHWHFRQSALCYQEGVSEYLILNRTIEHKKFYPNPQFMMFALLSQSFSHLCPQNKVNKS